MIHILRSDDDQFYFNIVSKNGKVLATSETYHKKDRARKGAVGVIRSIIGKEPEDVDGQVIDKTDWV